MVMLLLTVVGASAFSVEVFRMNLSQPSERHAELSNDLQRALAHLSREIGRGSQVTVLGGGAQLQIVQLTDLGGNGIADPADFAAPANFTTAEYQLVGNALRFEPDVNPPATDQVFIIGPGTGTQNTLQVTALAFTQQLAPNLNQVQIDLTVDDTTTAAPNDVRVITRAMLRGREAAQ